MDEMIRTPSGQMPAYVAAPTAAGPWPGVVVIHDFAGMSRDLRNQADWLAGEGYLAAAPDLYYWGSPLRCLRTIMREIASGAGRTFDDIDSVRGWLSRHDQCTGKIGVIGFCMGGAYAVALAPGHGYSAASVNYGGCPKNAEQALAGACPIVGSYGGNDRTPMGAQRRTSARSRSDCARRGPRRQGLSRRRPRVHQQSRPRGRDPAADLPGEDLRDSLPRGIRAGRTPPHRRLFQRASQELNAAAATGERAATPPRAHGRPRLSNGRQETRQIWMICPRGRVSGPAR